MANKAVPRHLKAIHLSSLKFNHYNRCAYCEKDLITVTKTYFPLIDKYVSYLEKIWQTGYITNNVLFSRQLSDDLKDYVYIKSIVNDKFLKSNNL